VSSVDEQVLSPERPAPLHRASAEEALGWVGHKLDDLGGTSVGRIEEILVEPESNEPSWLLVKVGRIGGRRTAVPFEMAAAGVGHVWVPFPRETIRSAPAVGRGTGLEPELEDELRRHYAVPAPGVGPGNGDEAVAEGAEPLEEPAEAPAAADGDDEA
jgi:hypothetical protein